MNELDDLLSGVLATLAFAGVGALVLAVGYVVLDAITPGNLRHLVYSDHNTNAAVLAGANVLALGGIVTGIIGTLWSLVVTVFFIVLVVVGASSVDTIYDEACSDVESWEVNDPMYDTCY